MNENDTLSRLGIANAYIEEMEARVAELEAHIKTITEGCARENLNIEQICGGALGYPRYCDDQKNFPGATEEDGVCVGEHVAASIASELAGKYRDLLARVERLEEALKECDRGFTKHCPDEWSTNGASWKAVREALGEPNPWEKSTP